MGIFVVATALLVAAVVQHNKPQLVVVDKVVAVDKSEISIDRLTGERLYQGKPFTGEVVTYYPSGQLASADELENGRWHGLKKRWFEDGTQSSVADFRNGVNEGRHTSWWDNGNLRSQTDYVNGELSGVAWKWYQSGELFKKLNYDNGEAVGLQQAWRENGKLFSNFEYRNGRVFGLNRAELCFGMEDEELSLNY